MSNEEPMSLSREREQQRYKEQEIEKKGGVCKYCGASLEEGQIFCENCGQKVGGEEHECPICHYTSTSEYCTHCGYKIVPTICPNCGNECHYDFCDKCGTILNEKFKKIMEEPPKKEKVEELSEERAREIEKEITDSESDELKEFIKKVQEHKMLLEEREYFNKREERIVKVFGKNPIEFTLPDEKEKEYILKAYQSLEKVVIERQEKAIKEELDRLYPIIEEPKVDLEAERLKEEEERKRFEEESKKRQEEEARKIAEELAKKKALMEQKYKELLTSVNQDFEKAKFEEEKRLEEERLRREEEERLRKLKEEEERKRREAEEARRRKEEEERRERERKRLEAQRARARAEQEARDNLILGTYVSFSCGTFTIKLSSRSGNNIYGSFKSENGSSYSYGELKGTISGNSLNLHSYKAKSNYDRCDNFTGTITGNVLNGIWVGNGHYYDYYKG